MHFQNSKTRALIRAAALTLALAVAPLSGAQAATAVYTVTAQKVNVRAQPDTDADILAVVRKGSDLTLISSDEDGWLKISTGGKVGYVSAEYAALSDIISGGGTLTAVVDTKKLYLRATPSSSGDSLALLERGSALTVTSRSGDWLAVTYNGQSGYISAQYVRLNSDGSSQPTAPAATSAPAANPANGALSVGSRGDAVKSLQQKLIDLGYLSGSADGVFGEGTKRALMAFQSAKGLTASGVADSATLNALGSGGTVAPDTTTAPAANESSLLKKGDKGDAVKALQQKLINLGYLTGSADGVFGEDTRKAVMAFQSARGLKADGQAGSATLAALNTASSTPDTTAPDASEITATLLKKGDKGDQVKALQQNLILLGYLTGEADGQFGPATKAAVTAFQAASGLRADGQAGEKTLEAIASAVRAVSNAGTLRKGSRGDAVKALQQKLIALGYLSGSADGLFGDSTAKAVMAFQAAQSLTADGVAGSATISALNKAYQGGATGGGTVTAPADISKDQVTILPGEQPSSYPMIKYGAEGDAVERLQTRLKELGYFDGTVGGNFGTITRAAVMAFQAAANLTADGIVGGDTWAALYASNAPAAPSSTLKPGDKNDSVKAMQTRLIQLGYLTGSADGDFGDNTRAAVRAFQTAAKLTADGIAGPQTLSALYASSAPAAGATTAPSNPGATTAPSNPSGGVKDTDYETGEKIVALAKQYLGCKYVYARENPPYFDCSGLTQYVYKQFGYNLKRTAYLQGYDDTWPKIKSISDLQVGDLIYFNTNETDADLSDHAGIYIGDGNFIHASSSAGKVVISSLNSGYYREHFSWGRRVLNQ
ncbi:MAG: peptidoglycan-binding protein [Clostridiales bacterium]|nr:peptidoglycan-binding protein [Clostridiales bacterium]